MSGDAFSIDDIDRAMSSLPERYQAHIHMVHPRYRGYTFAREISGTIYSTTCADCGAVLWMTPPERPTTRGWPG